MIRRLSLAFLGGCVGGVLRIGAQAVWPSDGGLPWSLFVVNLVGSFAIGVVGVLWGGHSRLWPLLGPGVLGGFTTFSAIAALEWTSDAGFAASLAFLASSLVTCTLAARLGVVLGERIEGARP